VSISFDYRPEDVVSQRIGKLVHGQWRSLSEMVAIAVLLVVLYVITRMVMRHYQAYFAAFDTNLPVIVAAILWGGITLGLLGAYLVMLFVSQYRELLRQRDNEASAYSAGPIHVAIGPDGIRTSSPGRRQEIGWNAVSGVVESPLGLCIRLDNRDFIPVSVEALGGRPVAEVARQINAWRGKPG
jgi:hypothetical protein